jgi:hypothetical protein
MALKKNLTFAVLGAALLAGMAVVVYVATARPRAEVAETLHDFGTYGEDQRPSHTFLIKNVGSRPLEITNVHPQCACTATAYDRLIPPGGQGALTLTIKPFTLRGQFSKKTEVFLNDPDQPLLVFTLKGVSRPLIEVQPGPIIRLRGKRGEEPQRQVRLTANLTEPWEISRYTNNIPQFIDIDIHAVERGRSYVIEVRQTRQESGTYRGMIELFTTVPKRPRLVIRVFGQVLPR